MGLTKKDRQGIPSYIKNTKRDEKRFDLCIMVIRFSGFFGPIFPASREMPNCDLRFTIDRKTQRFRVLIGSLIGVMHMLKYRIGFWNFLQRFRFLGFLKR